MTISWAIDMNKFTWATILILSISISGCRCYTYIARTRDVNSILLEKKLKERQRLINEQEKAKNELERSRYKQEKQKATEKKEADLDYYFE